jgi:hypothetical protein
VRRAAALAIAASTVCALDRIACGSGNDKVKADRKDKLVGC